MGNTEAIAKKCYLLVTDSNYERAIVAKNSDAESDALGSKSDAFSDAARDRKELERSEENVTNPKEKRKKPVKTLALGAEGTGLEPAETSHLSISRPITCELGDNPCAALALHFGRSNCPFMAPIDSGLLNVIEAWESLPEHIKKTVDQLVSLAAQTKQETM